MCRDNASSYYVTSAPDAASLAIHALAIGSLKWFVRTARSVFAPQLIERARGANSSMVFVCAEANKPLARSREVKCRTSSSKYALLGTWSLTVAKWKLEREPWRRCNRESRITSGGDYRIRNYLSILVPTIEDRSKSAPAGVFRK